jgi:hypothetical protein
MACPYTRTSPSRSARAQETRQTAHSTAGAATDVQHVSMLAHLVKPPPFPFSIDVLENTPCRFIVPSLTIIDDDDDWCHPCVQVGAQVAVRVSKRLDWNTSTNGLARDLRVMLAFTGSWGKKVLHAGICGSARAWVRVCV